MGGSENKETARGQGQTFLAILRQFFQGATVRGPSLIPLRERGGMERLLFVVMFGEQLGIPFLRPYYSLRLLPYMVPRIRPLMRSLLRERDLTDFAGH
jgi:hypothetical protein